MSVSVSEGSGTYLSVSIYLRDLTSMPEPESNRVYNIHQRHRERGEGSVKGKEIERKKEIKGGKNRSGGRQKVGGRRGKRGK